MPHTVILGAGIIGASTAYYLQQQSSHPSGHRITLLDPCPPACGASGKSGGFIARNWASEATSSLAELSFRLHSELAAMHSGDVKWGYRRARAVGVVGKNTREGAGVMGVMGDLSRSVRLRYVEGRGGRDGGVKWIKQGVVQSQELLGEEGDIAQWYVRSPLACMGVELMGSDPYLLTMFLV
jgi:glycine/D-amino acid oxidase-like deaminating enzyme